MGYIMIDYKVEKHTPVVKGFRITGEYLITGPRGGRYLTFRRKGDKLTQFVRERDQALAPIRGNFVLPLDALEDASND
jgi:hypothetical protein